MRLTSPIGGTIMNYWFKECPRCYGDLREDSDIHGSYVACMQCGYTLKGHEERMISSRGTLKANLEGEDKVAAQ